MNDLLSAQELQELTDYIRPSSQVRALQQMRIPFTVRPRDGSPVVARSAMIRAIGGGEAPTPTRKEPNFDKVK